VRHGYGDQFRRRVMPRQQDGYGVVAAGVNVEDNFLRHV
jgi:hypothetical protein